MEPKDNIIWPSFKRQFNTAVSGDNTVRKAVPYLDRYQQEQLERQQERQKRWEKQIHKRAVQKEFEERKSNRTSSRKHSIIVRKKQLQSIPTKSSRKRSKKVTSSWLIGTELPKRKSR